MDGLQDYLGLAGVPFIVALTELTKTVWPALDKRWWPLVAVIWGLFINLAGVVVAIAGGQTTGPVAVMVATAVVLGAVSGLTGAGLYSGVKALAGKS